MHLNPLNNTDTAESALKTITNNLSRLISAMTMGKQRLLEEKVERLEKAVRIEDSEIRKSFLSMIADLEYDAKLKIERREDLQVIAEQLKVLNDLLEIRSYKEI